MSALADISDSPPLLRMDGISKRFGATQALDGVSLAVRAGDVLALIGENGAGKSTLMKILSGAHAPDEGAIRLDGRPFAPKGPHDARTSGVAMIYQELTLAPDLSVEDNVMLGQERHTAGWLRGRQQRQRVHEALALLGHPNLRPTAPVYSLSVGARQLVEIARALVADARVIVFDEPTSSLTVQDTERLFQVIRKLKSSGRAIVYISHFLEEIRQVCDRFTVLRDGRVAGSGRLADTSESEIVSMMVGRDVRDLFPRVPHEPGEVVLSLTGLCGEEVPSDVSLELRRGEILGIAGLVGSGRTELVRAIFGLDPVRRGQVTVAGAVVSPRPKRMIRRGLGFVSEDRKGEGLAQIRSIADNVTYSRLEPYSLGGWLNLPKRAAAVRRWMGRLNVKATGPEQPVRLLSGGNQQKVAIARVLHQQADVLVLDEPTRGIDVGTKAEIYRLIGEAAAAGKAVIFVSSYLPELMAICDRIGVMSRGRLREVRPSGDWTEEAVMACAISSGDL
ncbi:MAG: sugar ABC transporter ATP-binding protein [Planctomycetia bacterium]|nr:sugar ABC transporter ATP-binding protein [Planctomycetia bacterium]